MTNRKPFYRSRLWKGVVLFGVMSLAMCGLWFYADLYCWFPQPVVSSLAPFTQQMIDAGTASRLDMKMMMSGMSGSYRSAAAFSPDDQFLVSLGEAYLGLSDDIGGGDDTSNCNVTWIVKVSELETRPRVMVNHARLVLTYPSFASDVDFNRSGTVMALNDFRGQIIEVATGRELAQLRGEEIDLRGTTVLFSPDDRWIFSTSSSGELLVWNAATFQLKAVLGSHNDQLTDVGFSDSLVTASHEGTARVWDIDKGESRVLHEAAEDRYLKLAVAPNGDIALSGWDHGVVIDGLTGVEVMQLTSGMAHFSPDGRYIMSYYLGELHIWDMATLRLLSAVDVGGDVRIQAVTFDPTSHLIVAGLEDGRFQIYTVTGELLATYQAVADGAITDVTFNQRGTLLVVSWQSNGHPDSFHRDYQLKMRSGVQLWGVQ